MMVGYNLKDKISTSEMTKKILLNDSLNILICHSASSSLAHFQTLELLQKYKKNGALKLIYMDLFLIQEEVRLIEMSSNLI